MYEKIRDYQSIICPNCDGEGTVLEGPFCFKPASSCCGACYEEVECITCNGSQEIVSNEEPIADTIMMINSISYRIDKFMLIYRQYKNKEDQNAEYERQSLWGDIERLRKLKFNLKNRLIEEVEKYGNE